jgi:hypothetical protein
MFAPRIGSVQTRRSGVPLPRSRVPCSTAAVGMNAHHSLPFVRAALPVIVDAASRRVGRYKSASWHEGRFTTLSAEGVLGPDVYVG